MDFLEHTCSTCSQRKTTLFSHLSEQELVLLDNNRYSVFYKSGEVICKAGTKIQGLICVNRGKVKIVRRGMNGRDQILGFKKAGNFIGLRSLMCDDHLLSSYVAMEDSVICIIQRKFFIKTVESNGILGLNISKLLAQQLMRSNSRLMSLSQKHLRGRLAEALLLLHEYFGIDPTTGNLNVRVKRSELAGLSNMTPANAIRILSIFKHENLIDLNQRDIRIKDLKKLQEISDLDR